MADLQAQLERAKQAEERSKVGCSACNSFVNALHATAWDLCLLVFLPSHPAVPPSLPISPAHAQEAAAQAAVQAAQVAQAAQAAAEDKARLLQQRLERTEQELASLKAAQDAAAERECRHALLAQRAGAGQRA